MDQTVEPNFAPKNRFLSQNQDVSYPLLAMEIKNIVMVWKPS